MNRGRRVSRHTCRDPVSIPARPVTSCDAAGQDTEHRKPGQENQQRIGIPSSVRVRRGDLACGKDVAEADPRCRLGYPRAPAPLRRGGHARAKRQREDDGEERGGGRGRQGRRKRQGRSRSGGGGSGRGGRKPPSQWRQTHRRGLEGSSPVQYRVLHLPFLPQKTCWAPQLKATNPAQGSICSPSSHVSSRSPAKQWRPREAERTPKMGKMRQYPSRNNQAHSGPVSAALGRFRRLMHHDRR